jgi:serine/threonine protein kinase
LLGPFNETLVMDWGLAKVFTRAPGEPAPEPGPEPSSAVGRELDRADRPDGSRADSSSSPESRSGSVDGTRGGDDSAAELPFLRSSSSDTAVGTAFGTPAYMSPEQAEGRIDQHGPWSDVYSLGATLYHLLTGWPPFTGDNFAAVLHAAQRGEFLPPGEFDPSIDPALEAVCLKAMATRVEDRYGSATELAEEIQRWMAGEPVVAWHRPSSLSPKRLNRHSLGDTAVGATVLTALAGIVLGRSGPRQRKTE